MKQLSPELDAHIQSGITTLATCWILKRLDGVEFGFTDHDQLLAVNGVTCEPETGMTGSELRQSEGFASDDQDISGILSSDRISEADVMSGRYDGATIETWRVNWQSPEQMVLIRTGFLGDINRTDTGFQTEIRGLSVALEQERGRIYQHTCDAAFGDKRCGVDLSHSDLSFEGMVTEKASPTELGVSFEVKPANGRLALGQISFLSGAASVMTYDILNHRNEQNADYLELWLPLHSEIAIGDRVRAFAGCDKQFATCRDQFSNQRNFRGFPHIPGNDFILSAPFQQRVRDGSQLVKD